MVHVLWSTAPCAAVTAKAMATHAKQNVAGLFLGSRANVVETKKWNEMIKNYYYLIVGVLAILFSFSHAWNGQANFLPIVESAGFELSTETIIFYIWHILTVENLIFGVSFLIMAFYKDLSKVRFTAWTIAAIMIARWAVIFGSSLSKNKDDITHTLTDTIAILVFVALIAVGTRKKTTSTPK